MLWTIAKLLLLGGGLTLVGLALKPPAWVWSSVLGVLLFCGVLFVSPTLRGKLEKTFEAEHEQSPTPELPIWRTIEVGGRYKKGDEWIKILEGDGFKLSSDAEEALRGDGFKTLPEPKTFELVKVIVGELGFSEGSATWPAIYARAKELGFVALPAEVGPALRTRMKAQPLVEGAGVHIAIAVEPMAIDSDAAPRLFTLNAGAPPSLGARRMLSRENVATASVVVLGRERSAPGFFFVGSPDERSVDAPGRRVPD